MPGFISRKAKSPVILSLTVAETGIAESAQLSRKDLKNILDVVAGLSPGMSHRIARSRNVNLRPTRV